MNKLPTRTILLVEDEIIISFACQKNLERYHYIVHTAESGEMAISMIDERDDIELVLMDIDLGSDMDGTVVAQKILEKKTYLSFLCHPILNLILYRKLKRSQVMAIS